MYGPHGTTWIAVAAFITLALGGQARRVRRRATKGRAGTSRTAFGTNCRSAPAPHHVIVPLAAYC
jgi:hypothetical protein